MVCKKQKFGADKSKRKTILIRPHGPKSSPHLSILHGHPVVAPPSWNHLLLQDKAVVKKSVGYGKNKETEKLRKEAKKLGVKVTMKKDKSRVYKSDKTLKRHIKMKKNK